MCGGKRRVEITQEESYIAQQTEDLRLHSVTCYDLLLAFKKHVDTTHITKSEFIKVLASLNLLPASERAAEASQAWTRFYQRFEVMSSEREQSPEKQGMPLEVYFDVERIVMALSLVTGESVELKARMLFEILHLRSGRNYLTKDDIRYFLNMYFLLACNFLPLLAKDYPGNKSKMLRLFREWNDYYPKTIDSL